MFSPALHMAAAPIPGIAAPAHEHSSAVALPLQSNRHYSAG
ncbi:hypothetical protein TIFTF001_031232 [Ficus carica]|uniref:Uncharacterized protein n=1 Tax=Ficus carica TaxID=3494 RepID=A0AA88J3Y0_FICCA|nr:hypothetical protein TIFTF001_031232 [Ficus carica]